MAEKERVVGFRIDITGVSNESKELAKVEVQLKNLRKEKQELDKLAKKGFLSNEQKSALAAYNKEIEKAAIKHKELKKVVDTADDSLERMRAELIRLKGEYASASAIAREKMIPSISKLNTEISKAEQAIGVHQRNVGNYPTLMGKVTQNFQQFGSTVADNIKGIASFAGIAGAASAIVLKLGDAFKSTTGGMDMFNTAAQVSKQLFHDIVTGGGVNMQNLTDAAAIAQEMNRIRQGDLIDLVKIKAMESDIQDLRIKAADTTLEAAVQQKYLNQAIAKENELIAYRLADAKEDLAVLERLLKLRPDDYNLQLAYVQKIAEIREIQSDKSLKLYSKESAAREKMQKDEEKRADSIKKWHEEIDQSNEKSAAAITENEIAEAQKAADEKLEIERQFHQDKEDMQKYFFDKWKKMVEDEKNITKEKFNEEFRALLGVSKESLGLQENKKTSEQNKKAIQAAQSEEERIVKESEDRKKEYKLAAIQGAEMGIQAGFESKKARLQAEMEAELSQANLTEAQKLKITKKYAREQQSIDVKKTIIAGLLAVAKTFADLGWPAGIIPSLIVAGQTAISVAAIKAQKFAKGGKINTGVHVDTGTVDDTLIVANKTETVLTKQHVARLGGSGVMRRIGVPGYANGGYIGSQTPEVMPAGFDMNALARMINEKEVVLNMHKLGKAQNEFEVITRSQPI